MRVTDSFLTVWNNMVKTIINYPFGDGLYHLYMVIWWMVYDIVLITLDGDVSKFGTIASNVRPSMLGILLVAPDILSVS